MQSNNTQNSNVKRFTGVALLVTHYNRSSSLQRLLTAFGTLGCVFDEIVVSDDNSKPEHYQQLLQLQKQYNFNLVSTPFNKGLGNNLNKGQDAVKAPYTLYVQEDFCPTEAFPQELLKAVEILNGDLSVDVARFFSHSRYPYLKPYKNGFSKMVFSFWQPGYHKFFYYSDNPHLRRSNYFTKFGRYAEGSNMGHTEYAMMMSFLKHKGIAVITDNFKGLFFHGNSASEPSTRTGAGTPVKVKTPLAKRVKGFLRTIKYSKDYLFFK